MEKKKNKFLSNTGFMIFAALALLIILASICAPLICHGVDPAEGELADAIMAPNSEHPFGTDKMGRDIFARVIYGSRTSLISTFSLVLTIFVVGTFLGIVAGYFGGWVDAVIMRIADMMIAFPGLVLAIAVAGMLGASTRPGKAIIMSAMRMITASTQPPK